MADEKFYHSLSRVAIGETEDEDRDYGAREENIR